jgi:DNA repair protein RadA/Sms
MVKKLSSISQTNDLRVKTNIAELDRVLSGGLVSGSFTLIGGESAIAELKPRLVIVDSIQAVYTSALNASPGSVSQVRECTWVLTEECRLRESALILSGHVTKDGGLAGPKILEHMVDTVLYFEGSRDRELRIIRSVKNRFGNVNEIAVFSMGEKGLREIADPGGIFIEEVNAKAGPGSIMTAALEGNRVLLAEIQALVTSRVSGSIARTTDGVDTNRVQRIRAILENQLGIQFGDQDSFVNVTGGLEINEPAVELAIAAAIYGSVRGQSPDCRLIAAGEIGLLGDLRRIPQAEKRVAQARKLGIDAVILPEANRGDFSRLAANPGGSHKAQNERADGHESKKIQIIFAGNLRDALTVIFPQSNAAGR